MNYLEQLQQSLSSSRDNLLKHEIYKQVNDIESLRKFTTHHVFAVWDFMSLLKTLQKDLTCVTVPWLPTEDPDTRFLINEIVLGEETDVDMHGNRVSHYELYLQAMKDLGAPTVYIENFINNIKSGGSIRKAIRDVDIPDSIKEFLLFTFHIIEDTPPHVKAAVFTFGREDLIPDMFHRFIDEMSAEHPEQMAAFKYYFERHIELDGDHHGNLSLQMVQNLCGNDPQKWEEATAAAIAAIEMRTVLWDGIMEY